MNQQIDANDAKAYLEAESILTPEQRPKAREIADQYRSDLYEQRKR